MIISCNECDSSFSVDDSLIKETGSKVRCSNCSSVFVAYPETLETDEDGELGLEGFDSLLEDSEEDDVSLESEGSLDELELDLDDFDDEPVQAVELQTEDLADDIDGEIELDLDLDDDDDSGLDVLDDSNDELPDLSEFEDLAGLDDDSLAIDDTDEEYEDLGFELETETGPAAEIDEPGLELEGDEELSLTDLDFEAEDEAEVEAALDSEELGFGLDLDLDDDDQADGEMTAADLSIEDADQLDLSDLELALDDSGGSDDTADVASGEFEFDLEEQAPEMAEIAEAGALVEDADQLDLSDLELELDDGAALDETAAADSGDLDLNLNLDEDMETIAVGTTAGGDELDLSDLELELDDTGGSDDTAAAASDDLDLGLSDDLDLGLDVDEGADTVAVGKLTGTDELDLSDLENMIATEETPGDQPGSQDAAEDFELDLDLETLEIDQPTDAGETAPGDLELDLSDLEEFADTDDTATADTAAGNGADELDLEFDIDEPSGADAPAAAGAGESAPDDDLLDIEKMLELGDDFESESENGEQEDLSLSMEMALDDSSEAAEPDLDLDFDIESELQEKEDVFDGQISDVDQLDSNLLDTDNLDFLDEAEIGDESEQIDFAKSEQTDFVIDELATSEFEDSKDAYGETDVMPAIDDDQLPRSAAHAQSRLKKPALAVLVIIIVAVGALILPKSVGIKIPYLSDVKIPYLSDMDIKIPYLSDLLNPQEPDVTGSLRFTPMSRSINGRFVDNSKIGRLFVIRGKIKNEYDHPRSFVKVTGKLYKKGQKLVKSATVYCGNVIPESDLTRMDIAAINKWMKNKSGNKRSNQNIKTGKDVTFMIVFDKLPNNLDEYTVEVASSSI
jgi:pilus assembly protein FimV